MSAAPAFDGDHVLPPAPKGTSWYVGDLGHVGQDGRLTGLYTACIYQRGGSVLFAHGEEPGIALQAAIDRWEARA